MDHDDSRSPLSSSQITPCERDGHVTARPSAPIVAAWVTAQSATMTRAGPIKGQAFDYGCEMTDLGRLNILI